MSEIHQSPPPPHRLVSRWAVALVALGAAVTFLLFLTGFAPTRSFLYLGIAAGCALVVTGAWEIVERSPGGFLSWIAFPVAWLAFAAELPFLALAAYPPLEEALVSAGRVEAAIVRYPDGRRLDLWFPRDVQRGPESNLRLNDTPVPRDYFLAHREYFEWVNSRLLSIEIDPVVEDLRPGDLSTVVVNGERTSRPFHYANGDRVPPQTVTVHED